MIFEPLSLELAQTFPEVWQNQPIQSLLNQFQNLYRQAQDLYYESESLYDLDGQDADFVEKFNAMLDSPIPDKYVDEFGDLTIRETVDGENQKFFAKAELNLYGPTNYYVYSSPRKHMLVAKEFYDVLNLPLLKNYDGDWTPKPSFDSNMEKELKQVDKNIAQQIIQFLQKEFHRNLIPLSIQQLSTAL